MNLCAAFPDLQVHIADIFAVPSGEEEYRVWMRYYFTGTNKAYSIYGAPTGQKLGGEKAINLSDFHVRKIDGEWQMVMERNMPTCDSIRDGCTGDTSFKKMEM